MKKSCLYAGFDPINLGIAELFVNVVEMVQATLLISPIKIYFIFHAETWGQKEDCDESLFFVSKPPRSS